MRTSRLKIVLLATAISISTLISKPANAADGIRKPAVDKKPTVYVPEVVNVDFQKLNVMQYNGSLTGADYFILSGTLTSGQSYMMWAFIPQTLSQSFSHCLNLADQFANSTVGSGKVFRVQAEGTKEISDGTTNLTISRLQYCSLNS